MDMEHIKSFLLGSLIIGGAVAFVFGLIYCADHDVYWPLYAMGVVLFVSCSWLIGSLIRL